MGNERQIEMLRAKVVASMPLRKSQQSTNSVAVEEREEGELSAEDEESLVPAMGTRAAPSRNRVPKLETRTQSSIEEKPIFPTSFKAQAAQPTTQVSIVNKSQLLNMFSAPAPPLASLQGPMPVRYPASATVSKSQSKFSPTDIGLARHQGTPMQIDANSVGSQMNSSMNKLREVAPAASTQPVMPSFGHPITHGRKRGRSREAITVPFMHSKVVPPVAPRVGAIAMSSGLHSPQPASAPVSGVHSEVEAFLASLHLPVVPTSSTPFSEENFVIKFDSDSDSEGEQQLIRSNQGQFTSATSGQQSTSISSQSPADMRSEIDRMKKQIAVMERSKAKTNSNSNLTSQSVTLSKNIGPRIGTVNLENLRQQIAAKENELLERRQRLAVTSPMEKPHLPVGKVLEQRNSGAIRVGDGQTRLGSTVQLTLVEQAVQNTGAEEGKLIPCGPRASLSGSAILSDARDVEGDVRLMFQKSGAAQTLKRAASEVYLSGELHKLRKVELPSVSQPQHLVSAAQSSTAQHGKGTLGVESISSTQADGHAIFKTKLEDGHFPVHTHTSTPVTKKSQTLSTRTNLSNPSGESASVPAEDMTFLVGSQGSQDTSIVISPTGQAVWASVEQGPITAFVVSRPDSGLSSKDGVLPKDAQPGPQVFVNTIPVESPVSQEYSAREGGMQLLQRLQEDEDAVDKALEEAQVRRRKCEVSEREARRLYQDAKTALGSANALCDALLHQRKLLSAQLHAAEFQMLQLPPFAVPTDRQLTSDHHAQLTELPLEFSSAAWTNQQQSPPRVHVKGNLRQGTCVEQEGQTITNSPPEDCQSMGSEMTMPAAVLKESPISKRSSDNSSGGHLLGLQMVAPTVGNQEVHSNLHLYPAQNVAQDRLSVQSHEIPDLSLDHWRVSTVVNKSDGVSPVHTVVKDSKVVKVRMPAAAADLEGLCEDSGTNGLECQRSSEEKNLQHLTQNGVGVSAPIENLPGDRSQKPVTQLGDTEKKDSDEINTPPNKQVQSADREQPLAGWESKTWSHDIDIWKLLCKFEHRGKCNNDACLGQHVADYTLDHTGLLSQLQRYVNPEKQLGDDGMSPRAIEAAIAAIVDEAQTSANLTQNKVASGKLFLEDKLQWNKELSVPIYQIGPYIVLPDQTNLCSRVRCLLGFRSKVVSFSSSLLSPALCRLLPPDVPCLLAAAVEDSSITSPAEESSWRYIEDAGDSQEVAEEHVLKHPGDIEAWLELALTIIDYDLTCQDVDAQKEALYILSRALEANPSVVVLWVVYIGLFYNRESSIGIDDMFHHAVGFNPASYELWLLLINSRLKLGDCLDAYKLALQGLCSLEEEDREEQSACILDLTLQMLNCMCIASQTLLLNGWVDELVNHEGSNRRLLAFLIPNDSCILWVGCAYAVAFGELPREFVQRFGCNQELPFDLNWDRRSEVQHGTGGPAIKLLHAGMNCLVGVAEQQSQHALAVNYVQCLSLYHGLNQALIMAHQLWKRHPGCLELVLLVARLEGNKDGVAVFEQAVRCWPQPRVGLQRLWNQYALHVLQWEGKSSALHVLYRCASRASALDSSALRELREDSKVRDSLESIAENDNSDGNFGSIGEDAVFAWLNLALFEVLSGEREHAQAAVERSLKAAVSREDVRHCWREMAALTLLSDVGDLRQPSHVLDLLDRCCMETSMHWKLTPLSSRLSKNISKRRLRSFIDFLLGPSPVDYSVVNSFVQQYIAKGLKLGMHTSRLVEGVLAVMPGNVEVVLPLCRLLLGHNLSNTQEFAAAVWTISIVLSTLLQACPQAPEQDWVEVGKLLAHLGDKSSLQEFYQHALVVYPFSAVLRHSLLEVQQSQEARSGAGEEALLQG
ncbi:unnamed protein product [Sphagnum jensenii]